MEQLNRIQFVVDGSYGRKIYNHLSEDFDSISYSINWDKLLEYTADFIESKDDKRCIFTKKIFFIGSNPEYDEENLNYYHSLESAGIQRISFPLRSTINKNGKPAFKEDAIDTSLVFTVAKDFYTSKTEDRFDWLVLLAGDGDLVPLVQGLNTEGVRTLVIFFDFTTPLGTTRASQGLLESAETVISLENLFRERVDVKAKAIFTAHEKKISKPVSVDLSQNTINSLDIEKAIINSKKQDSEGWVLVAQLGKILEMQMGSKLPYGVKLKTEIEKYPELFETKELPALSVRIKGQKKQVVVVRKKNISF